MADGRLRLPTLIVHFHSRMLQYRYAQDLANEKDFRVAKSLLAALR